MPTTEVRRAREALRRDGYHDLILHAAGRVVIRKGFSALTMDDVAREAQLSKATVYKYVAGKGFLLFEILGHSFDDLAARCAEVVDGPGSASAKLGQLIRVVLESTEEARHLNRALSIDKAMLRLMRVFVPPLGKAGAAPQEDRKMLAMLRRKRQGIIDLGARVLEEGVVSGEFRRMDTGQAAAFLEAVLQGYSHMRFWEGDIPLSPESAGNLARFVLEGIRNPGQAGKES